MWRKLTCLKPNNFNNFKVIINQNNQVINSFARISTTVTNRNHEKIISEANKNVISSLSTKFKQNPYVQLARMDRPIGTWLLYWPCGWSIALAADHGTLPDLKTLAIFGVGAFICRGAGCTINDMIDKKYDSKVTRTMNRPLVRGEIDIFDAWFFLGAQLGVGLLVLLELNVYCLALGCSSIFLVTMYPLMKRITHWPQFVLGMTFNWGALMGYAAVHGDIVWEICLPLYAAGISWTIIYDTIYAHQDRVDDIAAGIKSTAIRFGKNTKTWLTGFSVVMASGLLSTGIVCDLAWPYYASLSLVTAHVGHQIYTLNIDDPTDCAKKFISNHYVGLIIFAGILLGVYAQKPAHDRKIDSESLFQSLIPKHVQMQENSRK